MQILLTAFFTLLLVTSAFIGASFFYSTNVVEYTSEKKTAAQNQTPIIVTPPEPLPVFTDDSVPATGTTSNTTTPPLIDAMIEIASTTEEIIETPIKEIVVEEVMEEIAQTPPPPPLPVIEEPEPIVEEVVELDPPSDINGLARASLVNILCLTQGAHHIITPISGSGVVIDERGVVLTNAHIAQFYLFEDFPTEDFITCTLRTGSPAKATYKAELIYISPPWIDENAEAIATENPMGTGEHDFAFLLITETVDGSSLPDSFDHLKPNFRTNIVERGDSLLIGGYPAGFLGGKTVQNDLYASTAFTEAMELYTFDENGYLDLISLGGTVVAQQGASGGFSVNANGELVGLISTASEGETTSERDLRAISMEHVHRSLLEHNKTTVAELLSGDLKAKATAFNETAAPTLLQILLSSF